MAFLVVRRVRAFKAPQELTILLVNGANLIKQTLNQLTDLNPEERAATTVGAEKGIPVLLYVGWQPITPHE
jgi:hypothetical protein